MNYRVDVKKCLRNSDFNAISLGLNQELSSELNTVESKVKRLRQVFNWYASGKHFNQASELIKQLHPVVPDLRFALLECDLLIRSKSGDEAAEKVLMDQLNEDRDKMVWYPWTSERFGLHSLREQNFEEALQVLNNALNKASDAKDQENITLFKQLITIVEKVRDDEKKKQEDEEKKQADEKQEKEKPQQQQKNKKKKGKKEIVIQEKCEGEKEEGEKNLVAGEKKDDIPDEMAEMDQEKEIEKKGNSKKKGANIWQRIKARKKNEEEKKENENLERNTDVEKDKQPIKESEYIEEEEKKENENLEENTDVLQEKSKFEEQFEEFELFQVLMRFIAQSYCDDKTQMSYGGHIMTHDGALEKSFIKVQPLQVEKREELVRLTRRDPYLLRVEVVACGHIVTEPVCQVDTFFQLKLKGLSPRPKSNEEWWGKIQDMFWQIFRDALRGLMFLFDQNLFCGDVSFNVYVTQDERGRILPTMKHLEHSQDMSLDLQELTKTMKRITQLCCPEDKGDSYIPADLKAFFELIDSSSKSGYKCIPVLFLADYPYFLDVKERVALMKKIRDLFRKKRPRQDKTNDVINGPLAKLEQLMDTYNCCQDWLQKPTGAYLKVKNFPKVPYRTRVDIARYCGAVYGHINDPEYDSCRAKEYLNDDEIERDLLLYFPDYYRGIVKCLCECAVAGKLSPDDLMEVCTVYYKQS